MCHTSVQFYLPSLTPVLSGSSFQCLSPVSSFSLKLSFVTPTTQFNLPFLSPPPSYTLHLGLFPASPPVPSASPHPSSTYHTSAQLQLPHLGSAPASPRPNSCLTSPHPSSATLIKTNLTLLSLPTVPLVGSLRLTHLLTSLGTPPPPSPGGIERCCRATYKASFRR